MAAPDLTIARAAIKQVLPDIIQCAHNEDCLAHKEITKAIDASTDLNDLYSNISLVNKYGSFPTDEEQAEISDVDSGDGDSNDSSDSDGGGDSNLGSGNDNDNDTGGDGGIDSPDSSLKELDDGANGTDQASLEP